MCESLSIWCKLLWLSWLKPRVEGSRLLRYPATQKNGYLFLSEQLYRQIVHQSDPDSRKIDWSSPPILILIQFRQKRSILTHSYDKNRAESEILIPLLRPKPWMRKVRTSSRHLLAKIRAIHGTWYTSNFF